jgi:RNA polymerase sigma-70 factor (ECF subfamily)
MTEAFPDTRWSIVSAVRRGGDSAAAWRALGELCRTYWYPLYAFARGTGLSPEDAEDRTQDFFSAVLETDFFSEATPEIGRLRSFLLTAFKRDLIDDRRRRMAARRGGSRFFLSLHGAEQRLQAELTAPQAPPDEAWDRRWAVVLLDAAVERLRADFAAGGKELLFESLRPFLNGGTDASSAYDELCTRHGLTRESARQSVHRLRERFRESLRRCIADTLSDPAPAQVDEELAALRAALVSA